VRKSNLMLHAGAATAERGQVLAVGTPDRTRTWTPIPHGTLLESVQGALERHGLAVVNEAHGLTDDGLRYFGLLEVVNGTEPGDFGLVVGLRNSHDKRFPAGLVVGASVFVCDNLSFSGEVKLARKHTVHILRDLPQLVERAVGRLADLRGKQAARFLAYKGALLADSQAHDLLVRAIDARVLPVTKLPEALSEWRQPRHPEFRAGGKTAWRLFNALTEVLKGNLNELPRRAQALHGLLDLACGLHDPNAGRVIEAAPAEAQAVLAV
jgi:hypothetical protein